MRGRRHPFASRISRAYNLQDDQSEGSPQARAVKAYRHRLQADGLARFEGLGRDTDRAIIRALAKRLAEPGADANELRVTLSRLLRFERATGSVIVKAFRESPLMGADIDLTRERTRERPVDL